MESPIKPGASWSEVERYLGDLVAGGMPIEPVLSLVTKLAADPALRFVHRWTSHFDIVLARNATRPMDDDRLTISFKPNRSAFVVTLVYGPELKTIRRTVPVDECFDHVSRVLREGGWV